MKPLRKAFKRIRLSPSQCQPQDSRPGSSSDDLQAVQQQGDLQVDDVPFQQQDLQPGDVPFLPQDLELDDDVQAAQPREVGDDVRVEPPVIQLDDRPVQQQDLLDRVAQQQGPEAEEYDPWAGRYWHWYERDRLWWSWDDDNIGYVTWHSQNYWEGYNWGAQ